MQWIDWAILIVIGLSAGISLLRGFVREALSLAGWILAFFVAKGFYQDFAVLLESHIETPSLRLAVSWAALFFITLTAAGLVNYIIGQLVEKAGLSGMDRIMGMAFGALRGILVVSFAIIALRAFTPVAQDPWWKRSQLIPHVEIIGNWFYDHLKDTIPEVGERLPLKNQS
ncbi:CvpA family protein [Aliikangiella sp. G2MR2-5]|uniref:CvpA family protein n=1 Tax=Aliikangiella sp. G2MR2-5 TaxID=2788943 RepID=UPI0018AB56D0|nr:CvpA family protein [Aliikangiella sp. G2MR2-5]